MKIILGFVFFNTIVNIQAVAPRSVNVALDTVFHFDGKNLASDLKAINTIDKQLHKIKNYLGSRLPERRHRTDHMKFTDFLIKCTSKLKALNDNDLKTVVTVMDDEIRKYHYKGCKFYELTKNYTLRRNIAAKLDEIHTMPADNLRRSFNGLARSLKSWNFDRRTASLLSFVNSLYGSQDEITYNHVLDAFDKLKEKNVKYSTHNLKKTVRESIRELIFDHYSNLNGNARRELKFRLENYMLNGNKTIYEVLNNTKRETKDIKRVSVTEETATVITTKLKRHYHAKKVKEVTRQLKDETAIHTLPELRETVTRKEQVHTLWEGTLSNEIVSQKIDPTYDPATETLHKSSKKPKKAHRKKSQSHKTIPSKTESVESPTESWKDLKSRTPKSNEGMSIEILPHLTSSRPTDESERLLDRLKQLEDELRNVKHVIDKKITNDEKSKKSDDDEDSISSGDAKDKVKRRAPVNDPEKTATASALDGLNATTKALLQLNNVDRANANTIPLWSGNEFATRTIKSTPMLHTKTNSNDAEINNAIHDDANQKDIIVGPTDHSAYNHMWESSASPYKEINSEAEHGHTPKTMFVKDSTASLNHDAIARKENVNIDDGYLQPILDRFKEKIDGIVEVNGNETGNHGHFRIVDPVDGNKYNKTPAVS